MEHYGIWSVIPALVVVLVALRTKKTFEALLVGSLVGMLMLHQFGALSAFTDGLRLLLTDDTIAWIILVSGLFGSLIRLLVFTGGTKAFAETLQKYIRGRKSALLFTWLLGLIIFIDDYLNALTVGNAMKRVTDSFKVPREMLAYVVDSTAAPICVLIPISTWAIYISGLFESVGFAETAQGVTAYISVIPFISYAWIAALLVPFVAMGWIPAIGAMKQAELRVKDGGPLSPPGSEKMMMHVDIEADKPIILDFLLPIAVLIFCTIWFDIDALKGVVYALTFTILYLSLIRKQITLPKAMEEASNGFKAMFNAITIVVMSFVLKEVNDGLGLTEYVIESISPILNKAWLPALAFITLSAVTFATGSFWGVYAITLPIIIPLAQSMDAHILLSVGAVISAGAFGSHACFYGDATVLSSSATGCNNMAHALSQLPYALIAGVLAFIMYVILGNLM